jgi:hypothetical protein
MIITHDERSLIQRVFDLANLRDMRSARQVENLFRYEPLFKDVPLWRQVHPKDTKDFEGMRKNLRRWLDAVMTGTNQRHVALLTKFVTELQRDCAETALLVGKRPFKTWGNPVLTVDKNGNVQFGAVPLATGVQARVWYGLILLFARNLRENVKKCNAAFRGNEPCGNYYLKTKKLRIACSDKCKRILRHQQVYRAVKRIRSRKNRA